MIHLRGVVSVLGRFPALAGVDLDVGTSEVVLTTGPNGAGKTTLLRICAGLLSPTEGRAVVLGHELPARRRALRHRVGWLGHANALYDDLTVVENVRFWARAAGLDGRDSPAALDRVGLAPRLHRTEAGRLSAGQRRRVALASLIVRRPQLWLLDEPHAGLDASARDLLDGLVGEAAAGGATVVMASHDLDRGRALASRTLALAGGLIVGDTGGARNTAAARVPATASATASADSAGITAASGARKTSDTVASARDAAERVAPSRPTTTGPNNEPSELVLPRRGAPGVA